MIGFPFSFSQKSRYLPCAGKSASHKNMGRRFTPPFFPVDSAAPDRAKNVYPLSGFNIK